MDHQTIDLFEDSVELTDPARRKAEWMSHPWRCPACGEVESHGWLLTNNHGIDQDGTISGYPLGKHPILGGQCLAQSLVESQIASSVMHKNRWGDEHMQERMKRGRELGLDVNRIVRKAGGAA